MRWCLAGSRQWESEVYRYESDRGFFPIGTALRAGKGRGTEGRRDNQGPGPQQTSRPDELDEPDSSFFNRWPCAKGQRWLGRAF